MSPVRLVENRGMSIRLGEDSTRTRYVATLRKGPVRLESSKDLTHRVGDT